MRASGLLLLGLILAALPASLLQAGERPETRFYIIADRAPEGIEPLSCLRPAGPCIFHMQDLEVGGRKEIAVLSTTSVSKADVKRAERVRLDSMEGLRRFGGHARLRGRSPDLHAVPLKLPASPRAGSDTTDLFGGSACTGRAPDPDRPGKLKKLTFECGMVRYLQPSQSEIRADAVAWREASWIDTHSSYIEFADWFPTSPFINQAHEARVALSEAKIRQLVGGSGGLPTQRQRLEDAREEAEYLLGFDGDNSVARETITAQETFERDLAAELEAVRALLKSSDWRSALASAQALARFGASVADTPALEDEARRGGMKAALARGEASLAKEDWTAAESAYQEARDYLHAPDVDLAVRKLQDTRIRAQIRDSKKETRRLLKQKKWQGAVDSITAVMVHSGLDSEIAELDRTARTGGYDASLAAGQSRFQGRDYAGALAQFRAAEAFLKTADISSRIKDCEVLIAIAEVRSLRVQRKFEEAAGRIRSARQGLGEDGRLVDESRRTYEEWTSHLVAQTHSQNPQTQVDAGRKNQMVKAITELDRIASMMSRDGMSPPDDFVGARRILGERVAEYYARQASSLMSGGSIDAVGAVFLYSYAASRWSPEPELRAASNLETLRRALSEASQLDVSVRSDSGGVGESLARAVEADVSRLSGVRLDVGGGGPRRHQITDADGRAYTLNVPAAKLRIEVGISEDRSDRYEQAGRRASRYQSGSVWVDNPQYAVARADVNQSWLAFQERVNKFNAFLDFCNRNPCSQADWQLIHLTRMQLPAQENQLRTWDQQVEQIPRSIEEPVFQDYTYSVTNVTADGRFAATFRILDLHAGSSSEILTVESSHRESGERIEGVMSGDTSGATNRPDGVSSKAALQSRLRGDVERKLPGAVRERMGAYRRDLVGEARRYDSSGQRQLAITLHAAHLISGGAGKAPGSESVAFLSSSLGIEPEIVASSVR